MGIVSRSQSGGGGLPAQWTVGSDGSLFIDGPGPVGAAFATQLAAGAISGPAEWFDSGGNPLVTVSPTGLVAFNATGDGDTFNISKAGGTSIVHVKTAAGVSQLGFFAAVPVPKPTGVAVTAAAIHAALVSLGLIAA